MAPKTFTGHVFSLSPEKHLALFTHIQWLHHSYLRSPLTWFKNNSLISAFFWLLILHSWLKIPSFCCSDLLPRNLRRGLLTQTCDLFYSVMLNSVPCQKSNVHSCWKLSLTWAFQAGRNRKNVSEQCIGFGLAQGFFYSVKICNF